jgi:hypothetical protein
MPDLGYVIALAFVCFFTLGFRKVAVHERLAVFRLRRLIDIRGPGEQWIIPFIDRAHKFDLNRDLPDWQNLSNLQIYEDP